MLLLIDVTHINHENNGTFTEKVEFVIPLTEGEGRGGLLGTSCPATILSY